MHYCVFFHDGRSSNLSIIPKINSNTRDANAQKGAYSRVMIPMKLNRN